ncbi:MAG: hypothetical protein Q8O40_17135 [Chloroflexota bacterium]|nr:hypothetical protein [Chloroflexota bacterium]
MTQPDLMELLKRPLQSSVGPFKLDAWQRPNYGISGPIEAKGGITIFGRPAMGLVVAVLTPEDAPTPLSFGAGLAGPDGVYRVDIPIKGRNLQYGAYKIREIVFPFFGPPLVQDVDVGVEPDVTVAGILGTGSSVGSIVTEFTYANLGNHAHTFAQAAAVIPHMMLPADSVRLGIPFFAQTDPSLPTLPPGFTWERLLPPTGIPYELSVKNDWYGLGEVTIGPYIRRFDPFDAADIDLLALVKAALAEPDMLKRHGPLVALAIATTGDWLELARFTFNERSGPFIALPYGVYNGLNVVAQNWNAEEKKLWGFVFNLVYAGVWAKEPPVTAAAITSARWWTE